MLRRLLSLMGCGGLLPSTLPPGFAFLFKLAWESKVRLPVLIAVAFMLTDYHLQLEINVDVHIRDEPPAANEAGENGNDHDLAEVDILFEGIIAEELEDEEEEEDDDYENEESFNDDSDHYDEDDEDDSIVDFSLDGFPSELDRSSENYDTVQER